jgi:hypothetical protein
MTQRTAVVYLARKAEGLDPLLRFKSAYRAHVAGEPHDLVVIYKGFEDDDLALAQARSVFDELQPRALYIDDDGIDITAYLDAAQRLEHDEICFLNTFSEPNDDRWLHKLLTHLRRTGVGLVGATGSYESLRSSMDILSKVVWLCTAKNIAWDDRVARYYRWLLESQYPSWLTPSLLKRLRAGFSRQNNAYQDYDAEYAAYWQAVTQLGGPIDWAPLFPEFPNPHIRSNCFAIARSRLLGFGFPKIRTKMEAHSFESGYESLTVRVRQSGFLALVIGKDNVGYDVRDWPASRTFRLGNQDNILVIDNQVRNFGKYSLEERATYVLMTWGDYVSPDATAGVPALGKCFKRASM